MFFLYLHIILNFLGLLGVIAASLQIWTQPLTPLDDSNPDRSKTDLDIGMNTNKVNYHLFLDFGLFFYTLGVILGSIYAQILYGAFWVWDIKEILSLSTIILFFLILIQHPDTTGKRILLKITTVLGMLCALFTLILPNFLGSYHIFL